jgi:hypothetical protein
MIDEAGSIEPLVELRDGLGRDADRPVAFGPTSHGVR